MPKDYYKEKDNTFKSVTEIISKDKAFEKVRIAAKEYEAVDRFGEIFPDLTKIAKAQKVNDGVLYLKVENSVWRSELNFRKQLLIEKINKYFGKRIIKTIKFTA